MSSSESKLIFDALKRYLKSRGITYNDLAKKLKVSEASIKRSFSLQRLSLERLAEICEHFGTSFLEIAQLASHESPTLVKQLSTEQEESLAHERLLLAILYLLLQGWSRRQILAEYQISSVEFERGLLRLDKLGVLELHPKGRVKMLVDRNLQWRRGGPIQMLYRDRAKAEFLEGEFDSTSLFKFETGELSAASITALTTKLRQLSKEFGDHARADGLLPKEETRSMGMVVAIRPWILSDFIALKKNSNRRTS